MDKVQKLNNSEVSKGFAFTSIKLLVVTLDGLLTLIYVLRGVTVQYVSYKDLLKTFALKAWEGMGRVN
jgi:hypothetical protein